MTRTRRIAPTDPQFLPAPTLVSGIAGIALCICFLPSLAAIVFGAIAMSETKRTGQSGYQLAVAGLTIGVVTLLMGLFFTLVTLARA